MSPFREIRTRPLCALRLSFARANRMRNEVSRTSPAAPDACRPANLYGLSVITNAQSTTKKYSECVQIVDGGERRWTPEISTGYNSCRRGRKTCDFRRTMNACRWPSLDSKSFSLDTHCHIVRAIIQFRRSLDKRADYCSARCDAKAQVCAQPTQFRRMSGRRIQSARHFGRRDVEHSPGQARPPKSLAPRGYNSLGTRASA
jgi:hypothetical protein